MLCGPNANATVREESSVREMAPSQELDTNEKKRFREAESLFVGAGEDTC